MTQFGWSQCVSCMSYGWAASRYIVMAIGPRSADYGGIRVGWVEQRPACGTEREISLQEAPWRACMLSDRAALCLSWAWKSGVVMVFLPVLGCFFYINNWRPRVDSSIHLDLKTRPRFETFTEVNADLKPFYSRHNVLVREKSPGAIWGTYIYCSCVPYFLETNVWWDKRPWQNLAFQATVSTIFCFCVRSLWLSNESTLNRTGTLTLKFRVFQVTRLDQKWTVKIYAST